MYTLLVTQELGRPLVGRGRGSGAGKQSFPGPSTRRARGGNLGLGRAGHLEWGETLEECARREALEELGVTVCGLQFLCISNIIAYGRHYVDVEFLGDIGDQEPQLVEPEAFSESGWFPLDDLPQPLFEAARYALESYRSGQNYFPGE